ncbi:hypothetical protein [Ottowia testudinis]|uniref:Uncharacterized protein n=1 Tax=Ottowia testudinis TaxID=2816950 RepID=A0A975CEP6_9BURK|nr:hypothetical protein [Ottowia testudinis]QTD43676.1 hypothetical protein J1M35_10900 [Ottowia testudinis]
MRTNRRSDLAPPAPPRRWGLWAGVGALLLGLWIVFNIGWPPAIAPWADPALLRGNLWRTRFFGGIDRWATPGMWLSDAVQLLETRGFRCQLPEDPQTGTAPRQAGIYPTICRHRGEGLLGQPTAVLLRASHWGAEPDRLVSAIAGVADGDTNPAVASLRGALARLAFEKAGVLPPRGMKITGWQAKGPRDLALLLQNRLLPPEELWCESLTCGGARLKRFLGGLTALPNSRALPSGHACHWAFALRGLGMLPAEPAPATRRGNAMARHEWPLLEHEPGSDEAVQRWQGHDLAGRPIGATLALNRQGQVQTVELAVADLRERFVATGDAVQADLGRCKTEPAQTWVALAKPRTVLRDDASPDSRVTLNAAWLAWLPETGIDNAFSYNLELWSALDEPTRLTLLQSVLSHPEQTRGRLARRGETMGYGDVSTGLAVVQSLMDEPAAWPTPETLEKLWADPKVVHPSYVLALALMRCGAVAATHKSEFPPPDPACWRALEARAPQVGRAARDWLAAVRADGWAPRYGNEKRVYPWLIALLEPAP